MIWKRDGRRSPRAGAVATFGAAMFAVLAAGCDEMVTPAGDAPAAQTSPAAAPVSAVPAAAAIDAPEVIPMTGPFEAETGFAWVFRIPIPPDAKKYKVYEDGKELGPADSLHADIRAKGAGAYSHWKGGSTGPLIYFSTSDNSDPNTNGRTYEAK